MSETRAAVARMLGKLAEALVVRQNEKELETAMANIKARVEG